MVSPAPSRGDPELARVHALDAVCRPAFGGAAISVSGGLPGTLGCLVRLRGESFLLTSGHVLSPTGYTEPAAPVFQPSTDVDGWVRLGAVREIAKLDRSPQALNTSDVGLASVEAPISAEIGGFGVPEGLSTNLSVGDRVRQFGANSGEVSGVIQCLNWSGPVIQTDKSKVGFARIVRTKMLSLGGDSGAAVLDSDNRVVGVHMGGGPGYSLFCSMFEILKIWPDLEVQTHA